MKKVQIDLEKELTGEDRMTREGGEKLRLLIMASSTPISIDFHGKPIASVSFWDESIAKLLLHGWSREEIAKKVELKNVHPRDLPIIEKLLKERS